LGNSFLQIIFTKQNKVKRIRRN